MKKKTFIKRVHLTLDITIVAGSFIAAYGVKKYLLPSWLAGLSVAPNYYVLLSQAMITWILADMLFNPYKSFTKKKLNIIIIDNIKMLTTVVALMIVASFMFKMDISRILIFLFFLISFFTLFISKSILLLIYKNHYKIEANKRNILIVGAKGRARQVIEHIHDYRKYYRIIGCLDPDKALIGEVVKNGVTVIGSLDDLKPVLFQNIVDEVIFAMPLQKIDSIDTDILLVEMMGIPVRIFPDWYLHSTIFEPGISKISFDNFGGLPNMLLTATSQNQISLLFKSVSDFIVAFILLIILFPFFIMIGVLIKVFSSGPVFFSQKRMGLNGRQFMLYKFRTMCINAEEKLNDLKTLNEADGPAFKIDNDPRIIPHIGKFLRKTSIDELPQLFNVLKGNMSLVGPRPPIPSEVEKYNLWQRRRLSMKPGLTCLWQIKPNRNDLSFNEWMALDLNYIDTWSLGLDFSILIQTAVVVFGGHGR